MRKFFSFILILFFFSLATKANAQEANNYVLKCMTPDPCKYIDPINRTSVPNPKCYFKGNHNAILQIKDGTIIDNTVDNYIIEFVHTPKGILYSSGNRALDIKLFGLDANGKTTLDYLQEVTYDADKGRWHQYHWIGIFNEAPNPDYTTDMPPPVPRNSLYDSTSTGPYPLAAGSSLVVDGKLDPNHHIEWHSYNPNTMEREFKLLSIVALPTVTPVPTIMGENKSQQQGGIVTGSLPPGDSDGQECVKVQWDPYGRVFDSNSLEPVSNARVYLQKKSGSAFVDVSPFEIPMVNSPYIVKEDGSFSFAVPDGEYKLRVEMPDYTFPNNPSKLNSNYTKAFFDIYRGESIIQKGKVEHRDVPIDTLNNFASSPVKMMEYSYDLSKVKNKAIIDGRVSHPLTKIIAYSLKNNSGPKSRYHLLKTVQADKWGRFKLEIDQSAFEKGEFFGEIELQKVSLTNSVLDKTAPPVISLSYIPNYLEGYAFDNDGAVIPNAIVGIYMTYSNKPYFETRADEKGYYKIYSNNLPFLPYEIRYTSALGNVIKITTDKFIADNITTLENNQISLNDFKKNVPQQKDNSKEGFIQNQINVKKPIQGNLQQGEETRNQLLLPIIILILLVTGTAIFLGYYLYKKNHSFPPNI